MNRTVRIPRVLHELHGEAAPLSNVLLTWAVALAVAAIIVVRAAARPAAVAWWEIAIVAMVGADLAGGVVANFTPSTDRYYAERPRLRIGFLALHVIHPVVLYFVIGGPIEVWVAIPAYTLAAAFLVNAIRGPAQQPVAAALVVIGVIITFSWFVIAPPALWFAPLFLVKLVLGFAVRRT